MILVTGGTGLLGSHLLLRLVLQNEPVRAIYRTEAKRDSVLKTFAYHQENPEELFGKIKWVKGDILDVMSLEDVFKEVTKVYHCAAAVTFLKGEHYQMHKVNVEGTANVVNLCIEANIRLCHVSSVAAIGRDGSDQLISETNEWKDSNYNTEYALSKHRAELEVWRGIEEGLDAFMINPCLIMGPGDWESSSSAMFKRAWQGIPFYTKGGNCFVDVRDVVESMVRLMASYATKERFVVGAENRRYKDVFERIAKTMGKKPPRLQASAFLLGIAWRLETIVSALLGKKPFITKEIAHNSLQLNWYDNAKLLKQLPEFSYRDMNETLEFVASKYIEDVQATCYS